MIKNIFFFFSIKYKNRYLNNYVTNIFLNTSIRGGLSKKFKKKFLKTLFFRIEKLNVIFFFKRTISIILTSLVKNKIFNINFIQHKFKRYINHRRVYIYNLDFFFLKKKNNFFFFRYIKYFFFKKKGYNNQEKIIKYFFLKKKNIFYKIYKRVFYNLLKKKK